MKRTLKKLGEGVFGEVFSCYTPDGEGLAVKVSTNCTLYTIKNKILIGIQTPVIICHNVKLLFMYFGRLNVLCFHFHTFVFIIKVP